MQRDPEPLILFEICRSVHPITLHYCPEQCKDDVIKCCIGTYVTKADKFDCNYLPGVEIDLKYTDVKDCECDPCG